MDGYVYDQFQDFFWFQQNQAQIKEEKMKSDCQQVAETSTDPAESVETWALTSCKAGITYTYQTTEILRRSGWGPLENRAAFAFISL